MDELASDAAYSRGGVETGSARVGTSVSGSASELSLDVEELVAAVVVAAAAAAGVAAAGSTFTGAGAAALAPCADAATDWRVVFTMSRK